MDVREIASGLQFPEGPVAMPDGSVLLVEIKRGTLTRVSPGGEVEVVAELGGGPNGLAIGPDGAAYVCNNGGFAWREANGITLPGNQPPDYRGGSIQRVDLASGAVTTLYTEVDGHPLRGPNDLVFDAAGGFWFTDLGKNRERDRDYGGLYYALPDGSSVREVVYPIQGGGNGVGLSPDGSRVYVAETPTGRLYQWEVAAPGVLARPSAPGPQSLAYVSPRYQLFDSLAVEADGRVCVATIVNGGITVVSPDGSAEHVPMPDFLTTNICFGGPEMKTAYVTLSGTGRLVAVDWPRPGLRLHFQPS
jgi:gluconolactonase